MNPLFPSERLLQQLGRRYSPQSPCEIYVEPLCAFRSEFLCLGSLVGESLNNELVKEEGFLVGKHMPFLKEK